MNARYINLSHCSPLFSKAKILKINYISNQFFICLILNVKVAYRLCIAMTLELETLYCSLALVAGTTRYTFCWTFNWDSLVNNLKELTFSGFIHK